MLDNRKIKIRYYSLIAALFLVVFISACATKNTMLEQVQSDYAQAADDQAIMQYGQVQMQEAQKNLQKADKTGDLEEKEHLAYIAKKQIETARSETTRKSAEEDIAHMQQNRDKILVKARTREADEAELKAELAQDQAKIAEQRAKDSDARADQAESESDRAEKRAKELEAKIDTLKTSQTTRGLQMTVPGALFEVGKADLKPGALHHLEKLIETLKANPNRETLIEGHTDSTGSEDFNLKLSRERAHSVAEFLEQNGVDSSRILSRGYGESYPVASNQTSAGRLQNRRVDVILLNEGQQVE